LKRIVIEIVALAETLALAKIAFTGGRPSPLCLSSGSTNSELESKIVNCV
jgi:hypothetical protein